MRRGLLYAGTEKGMYVSFDDGEHWQSLQQNLPMTSVRDIDVHGDDLVIATHGRGFWIMDDVTPLRQMDRATQASGIVLFKPAEAVRARAAGFTGTPMPKDEPMAANPPDGAAIDYLLPATTDGPVTLTVYDANDHKVRSFTSTETAPRPDAFKLAYAPEWARPHPVPSAAPGMHRFYWDLHYPGTVGPQNPLRPDGVWAPPGRYTVELTADGQSVRQPLNLKPDPRVKVPMAGLLREFHLAMKVQTAGAKAAAALKEASDLMKALAARAPQEAGMSAKITQTMAAISDLSEIPLPSAVPTGRPKPPDRAGSLTSLAADFQKLERAVDGADADPSPDVGASYASLSKMLDTTLAAWSRLKQTDLAAVNAGFKAEGKTPLGL